jgi:gas vesicle protein
LHSADGKEAENANKEGKEIRTLQVKEEIQQIRSLYPHAPHTAQASQICRNQRKEAQGETLMPTQLDNIENDVREIKQDVKQLKERVLTLEVTDKIRQNMKTIKNQWVVIIIGFAAIGVALIKLMIA